MTRIQTVDDLGQLGQIFVKSGFFADTRDAAQAIVKVMAGQELGFAPIASMTGVYIVKGKVSLSANLIAAAIKRSGRYNFRVRKHDATVCEVEFFECDKLGNKESIGFSSFSIEEARAAKLTDSATWKSFPRNMLYARAISNGAKWHCPDVFGGPIYTPDELGATVDGETGEMIDVTPSAVATPAPTPTPAPAPAPKKAPRAIAAAPAPAVAASDHDDIEHVGAPISLLAQTVEIIDSLAGYDVADALILQGIARMTGQTLTDLSHDSIALLSPDELETLIKRYGKRLNQLAAERAGQPDRHAFDEPTTPADDIAGPQF
jgi:hypothetical protein